tara:strand:+ start:1173 stop:1847 length:675 start_codon:yes stop_codon:yes gene_type:complete
MKNYYKELGLNINATNLEIKSAYRSLAKKYHPDTGGNNEKFLALQLAWETLNDPQKKSIYDKSLFHSESFTNNKNDNWSKELKKNKNNSTNKDEDIKEWIKKIYIPINRFITQVTKPLNNEIKKLSADPYDDELMEEFCSYLDESRKKIERASSLFKSKPVPSSISHLGLDLYHCYSQVQDALDELDRYTQGYVDDYLFDGKQMMKEAYKIQVKMNINKRNISF